MRTLLWCSVGGCLIVEEFDGDPLPLPLEPATPRAWVALTDPHPSLGDELQLEATPLGEVDLYAALGEQIGRWDGETWQTITAPAPGLRQAFHRESDTEIYAVVGDSISMWDGAQWFPVTDTLPGLQPYFSFRNTFDMLAVANDRVMRWTGNGWIAHTTPIEGLPAWFSDRGDDALFACIGGVVRRWDDVSWQVVTGPLAGMGPAVQATSHTTFTVVALDSVWRWAGEGWYPVSDSPGEPIRPNVQIGPTGLVYAIVGQHVAMY